MPRNTGKTWTEEDKELLVKKYVTSDYHRPTDLVAIFGRSLWALTCQLNRLGYTGADLVAAQLDLVAAQLECEQKLIKDSQKMNDVTSRESKIHLEPTEGQLALQEALFDMRHGEVFTVRGMQTKMEYKIVGCEPFLGKGKVTIRDDVRNRTYVEDLPSVVACFELVAAALSDEYMVSVDGERAPKHVHLTYESACDEAERLARKAIGKKVRILKLENVIRAEQRIEVKECQ